MKQFSLTFLAWLTCTLLSSAIVLVEDFEPPAYTSGSNLSSYSGWSVPTGSATITDQDAYLGAQAVELQASSPNATEAARDLSSLTGNIQFLDLYVKPVATTPGSFNVLNQDEAVLWFTLDGSDGFFEAIDGSSSFTAPYAFSLDTNSRTNDWIRLTFRQDFASDTYDLYVNGVLTAVDLALQNPVSGPFQFQIYGDQATNTYFDEFTYGDSNPFGDDADLDGLPDSWETANSVTDRSADEEPDGLTNIEEYLYGTDPNNANSDSDAQDDGTEVSLGTDPNSASDGIVYVYEPFDYPAGTGSSLPVTGFGLKDNIGAGNFDVFLANSLAFDALNLSAGSVEKGNNTWWDENTLEMLFSDSVKDLVNLNGSNSSETLWVSFTAKTPSDINSKALKLKLFGWGDHYGIEIDSDTNEARLFVQLYNSTLYTDAAQAIAADTTYLYLSCIDVDDNGGATGKNVSLKLWVYELGVDTLPTTAPTTGEAELNNIYMGTDWSLFQFGLEYSTPTIPNADLPKYQFDELRMTSSFEAALQQFTLGTPPSIPPGSGGGGTPTVETPSISPNGGTYQGSVEVTLSTTTTGADLYYTTDGSTPTTSSTLYTAPFTLTADATVQVIGVKSGFNDSLVSSAAFTITPAPPPAGTLYVHEPFDYTPGTGSSRPVTGLGLKDNLGAGSFDTILAGSLAYGDLTTSNGSIEKGNNTWWDENTLEMPLADSVKDLVNLQGSNSSETLWLSFTAKTPSDINNKALKLKLFGWGDHYGIEIDSDTNEARAFVQLYNSTLHTSAAQSIAADTTYFFLSRIDVDDNGGATGKNVSLKLWVYELGVDALPGSAPTTGEAELNNIYLGTDWSLFQFGLEYSTPTIPNADLPKYQFDELRLGDSFAAVVPHAGLDFDGDGMPDDWELANGLDPQDPTDAAEDDDLDGCTNLEEYQNGTDPQVPDFVYGAGYLLQEVWTGQYGVSLSQLTSIPAYPGNPDHRFLTDTLDVSSTGANHYASVYRGYITAPLTGDYELTLTADDYATVYLSTDDLPENKVAVVAAPGPNTTTISLQARQLYYLEIHHIQGDFDDALKLEWVRPDLVSEVVPKDFLTPIPVPGDAIYEFWKVTGFSLTDLTNLPAFPNSPDSVNYVKELAVLRFWNDHYGVRLRALLHPPETGTYTLAIAADNIGELYLSTDASPANASLIGYIPGNPGYVSEKTYDALPEQSSTVSLTAGQAYYVEVLFKEGTLADHANVAWIRPGETTYEEITGEYISDYVGTDADRDGLPDSWEATHNLDSTDQLDAYLDEDNDGLTNILEYRAQAAPGTIDADGDTFTDLQEYIAGTNASDNLDSPSVLAPWSVTAIGTDQGTAACLGNDYFLASFGTGFSTLEGEDDSFQFLYQAIDGDFDLSVRINDVISFPEQTTFGLTVRDTLDAESAYSSVISEKGVLELLLALRSNSKVTKETMLSEDVDRFWDNNNPERWLRLVRKGDVISSYVSVDGQEWNFLMDRQVELTGTVYAGLCLSSDYPGQLVTAKADNLVLAIDSDQDGLFDDEETLLGLNLNSNDTDNDGVSDYDEIHQTFTDPNVAEFDGTFTVHSTVDGANYDSITGSWRSEDGVGLVSRHFSGTATYTLSAPADGYYRLAVDARQHNPFTLINNFTLKVAVDGVPAGGTTFEADYVTGGTGYFYLPYITSGSHSFTLDWTNDNPNSVLEIRQLRLEEVGGFDNDNNNIPDWIEARLSATSNIDLSAVGTSISPFTLEGTTAFPEALGFTSSYEPNPSDPQPILAQRAITQSPGKIGFFANIPLDPAANTTLTIAEQNGGSTGNKTLTWTTTNVFSHTGVIDLRVDDSLLIIMEDNDAVQDLDVVIDVFAGISSSDPLVSSRTGLESDLYPTPFESEGDFLVRGRILNPDQSILHEEAIVVSAYGSSFGGTPILVTGVTREWDVPGLDDTANIEHDNALNLVETTVTGNLRSFTLYTNAQEDAMVLARFSLNGDVFNATPVSVIQRHSQQRSKLKAVQMFRDGSRMVEVVEFFSNVPPNLRLEMTSIKTGVTFDDGSGSRTFTAADFDEQGVLRYYMIIAPGVKGAVCHNIVYSDDGT